jgi:CheY-like chemotaxis protein
MSPLSWTAFWQFAVCRVDAITTTTGIEAIHAAYQHNPGLITMDVSLPCMDGSRSFSNYAITASILQ